MTIIDNQMLWRQFGATIDMLGDVLRDCPDELWEKSLWEDQPDQWVAAGFSAFWYLCYHTLFWLDLYLTGAEEGFAPPAPFDLVEMDPGEVLPRTYALDSIYDFGLSGSRRNIKKPDDIITWLHEVLTALVPEGSVNLLGLSYGGWLVSQYTLRSHQSLQKVVLLDPAATVLPVSFALIFRALLTFVPLPNFRRQFYYWQLRDTVQSGEIGKAYVDEAVADWSVVERKSLFGAKSSQAT